MTYAKLINLLLNKLEEHPDFCTKEVVINADFEGDGGYYQLEKLQDIYLDDADKVNIDFGRNNND